MSANRVSLKCRLSYIMLALILMFMVVIFLAAKSLDARAAEAAEIKCREISERIITAAVEDTINEIGDKPLYMIFKDDCGSPVSAEIDPVMANTIRTRLMNNVEEKMGELSKEGIDIPLGTLTGISVLSGRGCDINVDIMQIGTADCVFSSSFEEAGINNVKLCVMVNVTIKVRMLLPSGSKDITTQGEYLIAETVFIGDTSNMYF